MRGLPGNRPRVTQRSLLGERVGVRGLPVEAVTPTRPFVPAFLPCHPGVFSRDPSPLLSLLTSLRSLLALALWPRLRAAWDPPQSVRGEPDRRLRLTVSNHNPQAPTAPSPTSSRRLQPGPSLPPLRHPGVLGPISRRGRSQTGLFRSHPPPRPSVPFVVSPSLVGVPLVGTQRQGHPRQPRHRAQRASQPHETRSRRARPEPPEETRHPFVVSLP